MSILDFINQFKKKISVFNENCKWFERKI